MQDVWTVEDGLPQNSITAVHRTQDGFLWVGTQEGLARFDGLLFETDYEGVPSSFVSALYEDQQGTLWVGTYGGLVAYDPKLAQRGDSAFTAPVQGLPGNRISALASDTDGVLWIGTYDGGLSRFDGAETRAFTLTDGVPEDAVMDIAVEPGGTIWIAMQTEGLVRHTPSPGSGSGFTTFTVADGLPDAPLTHLALTADGTLWITTERGLVRFDGTRFTTLDAGDGLAITDLRTGVADAQGSLWLGGTDGGLVRLHRNRFSTLSPDDGLPAGKVGALHLDDDGNLWVGTDSGGLGRLRDGVFTPYSTAEGLADPYVWSVYEAPDGAIWVGTEGGLSRLREGQITNFTTEDGLPSKRVISVRGTRDGATWAGTHNAGLVRYAEGQFTTFTTDDGLPSPSAYALYEDQRGTLWIGTGGGLVRYDGQRFTTFTTDDGLSSNLITVVREDARGCLLVGTFEGGLNTLCGETVVRQIKKTNGLPSDLVLSLHVDADGVVWAGLLGGLARIEGDAVHTFTTDDGLYSDEVLHIAEDRRGTFWMSSNQGLFRVSRASLDAVARGDEAAVTSVAYGRVTGQRTLEFNGGVQPAGWQSSDGALWLPTTEGLVRMHPDEVAPTVLPTPHLDALEIDGVPVSLDAPLALPPEGSRYHFRFTAPVFVAPERILYRYRLDGVDDAWIEAEERHEAFYTGLRPGAYTFRVQAVGEGGQTSGERTLAFEVEPHFYQSVWFLGPALLGATGLLYLLYLLRIRYLMARQRTLERLVEERTVDLREANHRLAETSELKSQLMHMVAHDLKNPLNGVHEIAKILKMELDPAAPQQEFVTLVEEAAEQMLAMVIRFLDAEALDSDTLNIERQPVDLAAEARAVAARFLPSAERKEQQLTVDVAAARPVVSADPAWLKEVLDNLVSNAVKFTPQGKRIWIGIEAAEDTVRFVVQDQGPGLTPDDLEKLFGKFQRLSAQPTGGESSSGLGLSIVQRVVELLGGRVWAENVPEGGSRFVVELPAADEAPAATPAAPARPDEAFAEPFGDDIDGEFDLGGVLLEG